MSAAVSPIPDLLGRVGGPPAARQQRPRQRPRHRADERRGSPSRSGRALCRAPYAGRVGARWYPDLLTIGQGAILARAVVRWIGRWGSLSGTGLSYGDDAAGASLASRSSSRRRERRVRGDTRGRGEGAGRTEISDAPAAAERGPQTAAKPARGRDGPVGAGLSGGSRSASKRWDGEDERESNSQSEHDFEQTTGRADSRHRTPPWFSGQQMPPPLLSAAQRQKSSPAAIPATSGNREQSSAVRGRPPASSAQEQTIGAPAQIG